MINYFKILNDGMAEYTNTIIGKITILSGKIDLAIFIMLINIILSVVILIIVNKRK